MKIECTKKAKENIINRVTFSRDCCILGVPAGVKCGNDCRKCLEENIEWVVTDNE